MVSNSCPIENYYTLSPKSIRHLKQVNFHKQREVTKDYYIKINNLRKENKRCDENIEKLQAKIDERKVAHNPHSLLTVLDAETLLKQYQVFLNTKKATLEEEIRSKNLRGLSERDMEEIKQQFEQFDKSKNGVLEKNEFKACLYSLGHEKSNTEVVAIMKKFGATDAKGIVFEGFKEFMIGELGDTDTKQDILSGFLLLANDNQQSITLDPLNDTMKDTDVDYLKQNCKPVGNGLEYKSWTDAVFAR